jgi:2-C-methyl-D-erythritol 4-phosphate cytidylyltransferase
MHDISVIIPAAGSGSRMGGDVPKPFIKIAGLPVLSHTLRCFDYVDRIALVILAVSEGCKTLAQQAIESSGVKVPVKIVNGGAERLDSIRNALQHIAPGTSLIAVHDAVRPFVGRELLLRLIESAEKYGSSIPGLPVTDTIKQIDNDGLVISTPLRSSLRSVQTPQIFRTDILKSAYKHAALQGIRATDDASLVEYLGHEVKVIEGTPENIKLTYPEDLQKAAFILNNKI